MADINACLHQWCFECEAAANQKSDQVRVALPDFPGIGHFFSQFTITPYPVTRYVRIHTASSCQHSVALPGFEDIKHRATLWVALRVEQKIKCPVAWQGYHIHLGHAWRHPGGGFVVTLTNTQASLCRLFQCLWCCRVINVHCCSPGQKAQFGYLPAPVQPAL